jgi:hypothetical protein
MNGLGHLLVVLVFFFWEEAQLQVDSPQALQTEP